MTLEEITKKSVTSGQLKEKKHPIKNTLFGNWQLAAGNFFGEKRSGNGHD